MSEAQHPYAPAQNGLQSTGRIPPQAADLEQIVLGSMILDHGALCAVAEIAGDNDELFYSGKHQRIYRAIMSLFSANKPADLVSVTEQLKHDGTLEDVGGPHYVSEITWKVASPDNAEYYTRILVEKAMLRSAIRIMHSGIERAYDAGTDAFEFLDWLQSQSLLLSDLTSQNSTRHISSGLDDEIEYLTTKHSRNGITGIETGFPGINAITGGWQKGDLIVIAGRPSMGKTSFALTTAKAAAIAGVPVLMFSLEMGFRQIQRRILASEAGVNSQAVRTLNLSPEERQELRYAGPSVSRHSIYVDDSSSLSGPQFRAKLRRAIEQFRIGLVIADYLQLMTGVRDRNSNREQEIASIARTLKGAAKDFDIPVIALSQLSRAVESRHNKIPQLSDLRESGALEQDADVVGFLYRAEYYGFSLHPQRQCPTENLAELLIAKQRSGPIGTVDMKWIARLAAFEPEESESIIPF